MAFEDLLDHRCDIYHMVKGEKDMGFAIKQTGFSYPKVPDVEDVACHFNVNANAELTQTESANEFIYSGKLQLPAGTDVRVNDKVVDKNTGLAYSAERNCERGIIVATTYVKIDTSDLKGFVGKLDKAAQGEFKKELVNFMEGLGYEFLRIVQDEIIRKQTVDTRLLLNSFSKGEQDNVFVLNEGSMTIEVGTNVKYAEYADKGHWLNPKGVNTRFVPGYWQGEHFIYEPGAKTGMLLKQKWIEGSHYWGDAVRCIEDMLPGLMEQKMEQWLQQFFM